MTDKLLLSLANKSATESNLMAEQGRTRLAKKITKARQVMLADLQTIGATKDVATIIAAEKILVDRDLEDHANSPKMKSSLKEAQKGLATIAEHNELVRNPIEYQTVNKSDSLKKMRDSRDLPRDGARQAFRAHDTRLENLDAGRGDDIEKAIIQQRQKNIRISEKEYIGQQYKALGIEPPIVKKSKEQKIIDALAFGGGVNAFSLYERGKTQPHKSTVLLLKLLGKHPELLKELA